MPCIVTHRDARLGERLEQFEQHGHGHVAEVADAGGTHVGLNPRQAIADEAEVAQTRAACQRDQLR